MKKSPMTLDRIVYMKDSRNISSGREMKFIGASSRLKKGWQKWFGSPSRTCTSMDGYCIKGQRGHLHCYPVEDWSELDQATSWWVPFPQNVSSFVSCKTITIVSVVRHLGDENLILLLSCHLPLRCSHYEKKKVIVMRVHCFIEMRCIWFHALLKWALHSFAFLPILYWSK